MTNKLEVCTDASRVNRLNWMDIGLRNSSNSPVLFGGSKVVASGIQVLGEGEM